MFLTQPALNQPSNSFCLPPSSLYNLPQQLNFQQNSAFQTHSFPSFNISSTPQLDTPNPQIIFPAYPQYVQCQQIVMVPVIIGPFPVTEPQAEDSFPIEYTSDEKPKEKTIEIKTPETEASPEVMEINVRELQQEEVKKETIKIKDASKKIVKTKKVYIEKYSARSEKILKSWYMENFYDPYPMTEEKIQLAKECGISINQVNSWFKNVRQIQAEIPCKFANDIEKALLNAH